MSGSKPILGYWDIRGLAEPIRVLLKYTKTNFQDQEYQVRGKAPSFDTSEWTDVKETLDLDFPNLPYFIDGNIKITQSNAILRYIAEKHDLVGKTPEERAKCLEMQDVAMDFRNGAVRLFYNSRNYEEAKEAYLKQTLPRWCQRFESCLSTTQQWFCGENLTFVDFVMFELLDQHRLLEKVYLESYPNIQGFLKRFAALEPIQEYLASPDFLTKPINNKQASFA